MLQYKLLSADWQEEPLLDGLLTKSFRSIVCLDDGAFSSILALTASRQMTRGFFYD